MARDKRRGFGVWCMFSQVRPSEATVSPVRCDFSFPNPFFCVSSSVHTSTRHFSLSQNFWSGSFTSFNHFFLDASRTKHLHCIWFGCWSCRRDVCLCVFVSMCVCGVWMKAGAWREVGSAVVDSGRGGDLGGTVFLLPFWFLPRVHLYTSKANKNMQTEKRG